MGLPLDKLQAVWPLLMQAPWTFAGIAVALVVLGWLAGRFMYNERISTLKERIETYKEKLGGASPETAAAQLAALQEEVRHLKSMQPWALRASQLATIRACISNHSAGIKIIRDTGSAKLETAQDQLVAVFQEANWAVFHYATLDTPREPHKAVTLCSNSDVNSDVLSTVRKSLCDAEIEFGEQSSLKETLPIIWLASPHSS
jgi:hypothetical protein